MSCRLKRTGPWGRRGLYRYECARCRSEWIGSDIHRAQPTNWTLKNRPPRCAQVVDRAKPNATSLYFDW